MAEAFCYIALTADGRACRMVRDDPAYADDTALAVAEFIREGLTVERVTWAEMHRRMAANTTVSP